MIKPACKKNIYDNIIDDCGEGQKRKPIPHLADDDGILVDFGCMFFFSFAAASASSSSF